tara:strand:+ start:12533 stop:13633 length:1101 start_codon:yes stop_codon:yes gene_type:complete
MGQKIKIFIIDDTVTYRMIFTKAIEAIPEAELAGVATGGASALVKLKNAKPDLVLLDIHMPEMNGVETLKKIKEQDPGLPVIMVSGTSTRDADETIEALELGALDFIQKPQEGRSSQQNIEMLTQDICSRLKVISTEFQRDVVQAPKQKPTPSKKKITHAESPSTTAVDLVLIGVSTGGPQALRTIIPQLPKNLSVPVLIVQHMPPGFTQSLAEHLDTSTMLSVHEAHDGETIQNGSIYIAPGDFHMIVEESDCMLIRITQTEPVQSCRPSVDVLFESVSKLKNKSILSIILTGMGRDGTEGVRLLKKQINCYSISQDKDSCVVYGMPRALEAEALSDEVTPLDEIGSRIGEICQEGIPAMNLSQT